MAPEVVFLFQHLVGQPRIVARDRFQLAFADPRDHLRQMLQFDEMLVGTVRDPGAEKILMLGKYLQLQRIKPRQGRMLFQPVHVVGPFWFISVSAPCSTLRVSLAA